MNKRFSILLCLAISAGLFFTEPAFASGHWEDRTDVVSRPIAYSQFTYKYCNRGYWYIADNSGGSFFYDWNINYRNGYANTSGYAVASFALPTDVINARAQGKTITATLEHPGTYTSVDFNYSYSVINGNYITCYLKLNPQVSSYTVNSFVSGLPNTIPLVDSAYGQNLYLVKPTIGAAAYCPGWFSSALPYFVNSPYIHPSSIYYSNGSFKSGTSIIFNNAVKNTAFCAIYSQGAAFGAESVDLVFYCPLAIKYTASYSVYVEDPPVWTGGNSGGGNTTGGGTQPSLPPTDPGKPQTQDPPAEDPPAKKDKLHRVR